MKRKIADNQTKSKTIKKSKFKKPKAVKSNSEGEDSDTGCLYCGYFYSDSTEGWISCSSCHKRAHNSAGVEDEEAVLLCELCQ